MEEDDENESVTRASSLKTLPHFERLSAFAFFAFCACKPTSTGFVLVFYYHLPPAYPLPRTSGLRASTLFSIRSIRSWSKCVQVKPHPSSRYFSTELASRKSFVSPHSAAKTLSISDLQHRRESAFTSRLACKQREE